ncbi:unnamed protein product [Closterium sp. NIES-53]
MSSPFSTRWGPFLPHMRRPTLALPLLRLCGSSLGLNALPRYSSPFCTTLGQLALPFLFLELSDFATVADLMTHLCSLDTRYHAALKPDFMAENQPPMYLTLYFLTNRPSFCAIFLFLDPIELTLASFETRLLEAETSARAVATSRGTPSPSFCEGCSPSLLTPSVASAAAFDFIGAEKVGAASAPSGPRLEGVEARVQLPEELSLVVQLVEVEIPGVDNKTSHIGKRLLGRSSYVSGLPSEAAQEAEVASSTSTSYSCSSCMRTCGGGGGCRHWNC